MVEVEHGRLGPLEQNRLVVVQRALHHSVRVRDVRDQAFPVGEVLLFDLGSVERESPVDARQQQVLLLDRDLELRREDLGVEEVLNAQADARGFVRVGRTDPTFRSAEPVLPQAPLRDLVQLQVVGHDQVRVPGQQQPGRVDPPLLERVHLLDEHLRVDDDARADDGNAVRIEDPGGDQVQRVTLLAHHDGVPRVVPALISND